MLSLLLLALGFYAIYIKSLLNHSNQQLFKALRYQTISVGVSMLWFREMNIARKKYNHFFYLVEKEFTSADGEFTYQHGITTVGQWLKHKGLIDYKLEGPLNEESFKKSLEAHEAEIASFPRSSL